ncbi:MAG: chemotaxis protein CheA [Acidobacteriaceae bacterium]|nr:chemotaxis protein CheA [Acidobacteriaceae bacterium]
MAAELDDEVREFIIECNENLTNLDQEIVRLEQTPEDAKLLASVFRTFHTIKGTCGFFGFSSLGSLTHVAENILDQIRSSNRKLTSELTALLLECVDATKAILSEIENTGAEGEQQYESLRTRLTAAYSDTSSSIATPTIDPTPQVAPTLELTVEPEQSMAVVSATGEIEAAKASAFTDSTIRVDVGLLDKLMNLVGELVLARNQLLQGAASGHDLALVRTVQRLNVITSELQEGVLKTRMQPIGVVWNKMPRVVRDLSTECGKKIRIEMEGADTELDKTIIEAIKDPLTHIVRNACDHGVETPEARTAAGKPAEGLVTLRAYHEGGHVNIEIADDGRGLDPLRLKQRAMEKGLITAAQVSTMSEREAIHLVFAPGFSTAQTITNISGRGVGMDVVKTNIGKIGGIVDIANRAGCAGSVVKITIPLTLAIIPGLVIRAYSRAHEEHRFIIPQANLLELVRLDLAETRDSSQPHIEYVNGTPVYRRRGELLPLTYMNRILGLDDAVLPSSSVINIVVLQSESQPFGLIVDGIYDTQEIVVKPMSKRLKNLSAYLGATIMGDGRVALILDIPGLAKLSGMEQRARDVRREDVRKEHIEQREGFLIFRAGGFSRIAVPLGMVSRLEQLVGAQIESAAGQPVLLYRGEILPLLQLSSLLHEEPHDLDNFHGDVQIVVITDGPRRIGLIVDKIVDIVEESVTFRSATAHRYLSGTAILGNTVIDILDCNSMLSFAAVTDPGYAGKAA